MPRRNPKSKPERLTTLLHLAKLGAGVSFANISTKELAHSIGFSQQAASLRLIELQKSGLIQRAHSGRGLSVRLTDQGLREAGAFYGELKGALEGKSGSFEFVGTVFTGLGEGGYYVSLKGYAKPFLDALGFEPFAGTLNLRLTSESMVEQRKRLDFLEGVEVAGFRDRTRTYGPVKCFKAIVGGKSQGAVLAIERTHYDSSVMEVISPVNLRKALRLKDGDECAVRAFLGNVS